MKRIYIMRHGKAVARAEGLEDIKRGLTDRGKADARLMGQYFRREDRLPQLILTSNSVRTRQTTLEVLAGAATKIPTQELAEFFFEGIEPILKKIHGLDDQISRVLIIGHNPDLEDLASNLSDSESMSYHISTSALLDLSFQTNRWGDIKDAATVEAFLRPRILKDLLEPGQGSK